MKNQIDRRSFINDLGKTLFFSSVTLSSLPVILSSCIIDDPVLCEFGDDCADNSYQCYTFTCNAWDNNYECDYMFECTNSFSCYYVHFDCGTSLYSDKFDCLKGGFNCEDGVDFECSDYFDCVKDYGCNSNVKFDCYETFWCTPSKNFACTDGSEFDCNSFQCSTPYDCQNFKCSSEYKHQGGSAS